MKVKQIACRSIVAETQDHPDTTPGITEKFDWLDLCDLAYSDDAHDKGDFVRFLERHQPDVVTLAVDLIQNGQTTPVQVRKAAKDAYVLVKGRRRLLAVLYNACRIQAPVPRINAVILS